jgi:hypothetical protein
VGSNSSREGTAETAAASRFPFHPTDEELVVQYLRHKSLALPLPTAVIPVVHAAALPDL